MHDRYQLNWNCRVVSDPKDNLVQPPAMEEYFVQCGARTHKYEIKRLMLYGLNYPAS